MEIIENQKSELLKKVEEIRTAEGFVDSYEMIPPLRDELKGMIKMNKHKCKYCNNEVDGSFRCDSCNLIWNEGVEFGREDIRQRLKGISNDFKNIIGGEI